jgi:hypothetical protein
MKTANDLIEGAALECDREADRQALYASEAGTPGLKLIHGTAANTLMSVAQRIRGLKPDPDYTPRRLQGPLKDVVMYDEGFQAALQDYHHNGGSSARVAAAALKAIGEE